MRWRLSRWAALAVLILALALLVAAGCTGSGAESGPGTPKQIRGLIVLVTPRSLTEVETLRLRDRGGKVWTFTAEGPLEFTPSHLREHQLLGQSVVVTYVAKGDRLVAVKVTD